MRSTKLPHDAELAHEAELVRHLQTDEVCMGIGYFFPSTGPKFCVDGTTF